MSRKFILYTPTLNYCGGVEASAGQLIRLLDRVVIQTHVLTETEISTFQFINNYYEKRSEFFVNYGVYPMRLLKHIGKDRRDRICRSSQGSSLASIIAPFVLVIRLILLKMAIHRVKPSLLIMQVPNIYSLILLLFFKNLPRMAWVHTTFTLRRGGLFWILNKLVLALGSKGDKKLMICSNSDIGKEHAGKLFPGLRIEVLYPPYDDRFFYPRFDLKELGRILVVARIAKHKRIEKSLEAASLLKHRHRCSFKLRIIGDIEDPDYHTYLERRILELHLEDRVSIIPNPTLLAIRSEYWSSWVCWNFSEGTYGRVNVEAMACGCVVLATPNMIDVVGPEFVCKNIEEFANKTAELIRNPNLCLVGRNLAFASKQKYSETSFDPRALELLSQIVWF